MAAENVTFAQFIEVLEHNKGNDRDADIWVLHENGSTSIIPDQDTTELQSRRSWPMYICRAAAINAHVATDTEAAATPGTPDVAVDGLYKAYEYLNWAISMTVVAASTKQILAFAVKSGYRAMLAGFTRGEGAPSS